jgi:hypothetical protein
MLLSYLENLNSFDGVRNRNCPICALSPKELKSKGATLAKIG